MIITKHIHDEAYTCVYAKTVQLTTLHMHRDTIHILYIMLHMYFLKRS